ncbi:hypothetical protein [Nocardia wallacei]|nr:hypothetical protein [Nocardia wallacei]
MSDDQPRMCQRCREKPVGGGGILCPDCLALLTARAQDPYGEWTKSTHTP